MISIATPTNRGVVVKGNTTRNAQINKYNTGSRILTWNDGYTKVIEYQSPIVYSNAGFLFKWIIIVHFTIINIIIP